MRRGGDALGTRKLHGIQRGGKHVFENGLFVRRKLSEHVSDDLARLAGADAEFEAGKQVITEVLEDRFDTIVATGGAFFAEAEGAKGEGGVVVNHQNFLGRPLVKREDLLDGATAEVHKRLRFE